MIRPSLLSRAVLSARPLPHRFIPSSVTSLNPLVSSIIVTRRHISVDKFSEGPIFKAELSKVMSGAGPHTTVSDAITTDHRELETYYKEICNAFDKQDHDGMTRWQNQFVWELARHSVAEVCLISFSYPLETFC